MGWGEPLKAHEPVRAPVPAAILATLYEALEDAYYYAEENPPWEGSEDERTVDYLARIDDAERWLNEYATPTGGGRDG